MTIAYEEARSLLENANQGHLLQFWDQLDETQREALLEQIDALDLDRAAALGGLLKANKTDASVGAPFEPAPVLVLDEAETADARIEGEKALAAGQVGVLLVAGGQGSRLGFDGPKGSFPIGPVSNATLFEIHARKILALEQLHSAEIPFYIMTSEANDADTRAFFEEHNYFGLSSERVKFFVQGMWPALWGDGRIVLDEPGHIFTGPDGHGGILSALDRNGMLADMSARGLESLFYFQVDNAMVDIASPAFVGVHRLRGSDISVKVCAKRDPDEGLGVVVVRDGRYAVVEYTELTDEQKRETLPDGNLRLRFGSVAIHVFSLDFLKREAARELPIHIAHKKVPYCADDGTTVKPDEPNAYKFEKFIFDVLPDAAAVLNVAFAREDEFSPVKNAEGNDSPATAQRDLILKFARWLDACGVHVPRDADGVPVHKIEIDPCYALGPAQLAGKVDADLSITEDLLLA